MLIPPSVLMIVWSILTEMSVGALFMAGLVPGLILAGTFGLYVVVAALRRPEIAPAGRDRGTLGDLPPPTTSE
ncbi:TRAP transporter large permease subunit, partial [Klebsiella pneumoniae]|nr:TRAP transporter large permease subunit [Klebsiella pneumoniae]